MDVRFGLVAIFLILDVISARSTGLGNRSLRKKRYSSGVKSPQSSFINPSIENNNFQQSSNNNKSQLSSDSFASQGSRIVFPDEFDYISSTFRHNRNESILNSTEINLTDTVDIEPSSSQRPFTQGHTASLPYDTSTQAHDNTISRTPTPPKEMHSAVSQLSLDDLISIKASSLVKPTSELKCEEYAREVASTVSRTGTYMQSQRLRRNVINTCETVNYLTIRGFEARDGEFPHMVGLLGRFSWSDEMQLMCGGSLISHSWVLTAAHCTSGRFGMPKLARIGSVRLSGQQGITIGVKNIISHPNYRSPAMYADVALIKLMKAVTFSATIQPACLYQQYDAVPRKAWISGWGVTEFGGEPEDRLQMTELDIVDNLYCSKQYNISTSIPYGIITSQMCAGDPRGNWSSDSCQGDSGGPLQIRHENECLFRLIGIISFGSGCALTGVPGVYTRVSYYLPWIEDNVWPQGQ